MRKFLQNKLWRDKAVEIVEQQGARIHWRTLNDTEFLAQLRLKLLEEAEEVASAKTRQEMISELADLFEVIDALTQANTIAKSEITEVQLDKQRKRGSFFKRMFVTISEHPVGSAGEQYCLADPKKYPEMT